MAWRILVLLLSASVTPFAQVASDPGHQAAMDLRAGDFRGAREIVDAALKHSPGNARLWTLRGITLVHLGSPSEALASFNRAQQLAPTYYPALEGAAQLESQTGDPRAIVTLQRMLSLRPDDVSALRELAYSLVKQKRASEALPVFQHLAALEPSDAKELLDLASVQFLTAHYADVISTLTPFAAQQPTNVQALELLGEAYSMTSETDKALAVLATAIAANPGATQTYLAFANVCLAHGQFQTGLENLNAAIQRIPDAAPLYVARGVLFSELGQYENGEADFKHAEQLDPNVEGGSTAKGLAELQRDDLGDAETTIRAKLQIQPRDAFAQYLLAEVLTRKGATPGTPEFQRALSAARQAVALKPDLAPARDLLGRLYLQQGEVEEAIRQSRLALQYNPADQKALYHLILALRKGGHTEEVPALLKLLVALRQQAGSQNATEHIEESATSSLAVAQP